jgi:hypothetical protein
MDERAKKNIKNEMEGKGKKKMESRTNINQRKNMRWK